MLDKRSVLKGLLLDIEHWRVELPDGREALRELAFHMGAVAVVPVDEAGYTTLVRQYRTAMGRVMLEIPAGKLDSPDENREEAARRELREETGLTARELRHLNIIVPSPGYLTERIWLYMATGLARGESAPDEDEFIECVRLPLAEAVEMVMRGQIDDAKSVCALMMAWNIYWKNIP